jgi:hypothetical protein
MGADSKSRSAQTECGFDPRLRHQQDSGDHTTHAARVVRQASSLPRESIARRHRASDARELRLRVESEAPAGAARPERRILASTHMKGPIPFRWTLQGFERAELHRVQSPYAPVSRSME